MTEKRRGRPPKAKPCPDCGQTGSHYDDCAAGMGVLERDAMLVRKDFERLAAESVPKSISELDARIAEHHADMLTTAEIACGLGSNHERNRAQAYALRVWRGQSVSALRPWRIQRVKEALAGQNLPFDGVELPE